MYNVSAKVVAYYTDVKQLYDTLMQNYETGFTSDYPRWSSEFIPFMPHFTERWYADTRI